MRWESRNHTTPSALKTGAMDLCIGAMAYVPWYKKVGRSLSSLPFSRCEVSAARCYCILKKKSKVQDR